MAWRHHHGRYAGMWELTGKVIDTTPKAIQFDFGLGRRWWVPRRGIIMKPTIAGDVVVYMQHWLYQLKLKDEQQEREKVNG